MTDFHKSLETKSKALDKQMTDFREGLETKSKALDRQVTDFREGLEAKKQELDNDVKNKKQELDDNLEAKKQELDEKMTDQINKAQKISKIYKTIEPELLKMRTLIILTPAILIAFGVFFGDRIKDIMSIDVLEKEVELLRDDIKSLQPQQGQGSYQPWEGGHCPYGEIFPDCYHTPAN